MLKRLFILTLLPAVFLFYVGPFIPYVVAQELIISGNGSSSTSEVLVNTNNTESISQSNTANIVNNIEVIANTGNNNASDNTSGSVTISTGDVLTDLVVSNNINSATVNNSCCDVENNSSVSIVGNGSGSDNSVVLNINDENSIVVNQYANIENKVIGTANTGNNSANNNTSSEVTILTGDIKVNIKINNYPVNTSLVNFGNSPLSVFANISDNGANTTNYVSANINKPKFVGVNNYFVANNISYWDLKTGGNTASGNTSSKVLIKTGNVFFDLLISNAANIGGVDLGCCGVDPDDLDDPNDPDDPSDPGGYIGGGGGNGGSTLGSSINFNGPAILGLSATSSK